MKLVRDFLRAVSGGPGRGWLLIFLLGNALINLDYGTNPESRFATLCAMVEDHSFRIDHYQDLTIDWARTPDGHYYSNKAPGPMLLAFPAFWLIDKIITAGKADRAARDEARLAYRWLSLKLLSLLFQALPFTVLVVIALSWLKACGVSREALHLSCVAMLFGNTAALFMNTYFGHAVAAMCVFALCLCLIKRWYVWSGLVYGLALLADYSSAVLLPGFLVAVILQEPPKKWFESVAKISAGGVFPGVLWVLYHVSCFGGPFTLPSQYQNPMFVDTTRNQILGIFNLAPEPTNLAQLLFGFRRGTLWSQPWVLIVLAVCLARRTLLATVSDGRWAASLPLLRFLVPGFILLLWMNASFDKWHGGATPGPRYMCSVFPAFGLLAGLFYDGLSLGMRRLTIGAVALSVVFWVVAYSTTILVPENQTMWGYTLGMLMNPPSYGSMVRFTGLALAFQWRLFAMWSGANTKTIAPGST